MYVRPRMEANGAELEICCLWCGVHFRAPERTSNMRSKATPSSQNGPQKACPRTSNGIQMVSNQPFIESSSPPIIGSSSLGAGGRGRSPSDIYICIYSFFGRASLCLDPFPAYRSLFGCSGIRGTRLGRQTSYLNRMFMDFEYVFGTCLYLLAFL